MSVATTWVHLICLSRTAAHSSPPSDSPRFALTTDTNHKNHTSEPPPPSSAHPTGWTGWRGISAHHGKKMNNEAQESPKKDSSQLWKYPEVILKEHLLLLEKWDQTSTCIKCFIWDLENIPGSLLPLARTQKLNRNHRKSWDAPKAMQL